MKKFVAVLLIAILSLGMLAACGKKDGGDNTPSNQGDSNNGSQPAGDSSADGSAIIVTDGDKTYSIDASTVSGTASVDMGSLYVADAMINTGIQRPGNVQRIADALYRASKGEAITIAFIGGSATEGDGASAPEKAYTALVKKWFDDSFAKTEVKEVNIGLRNQDSYLANHRIAEEVIPSKPDIVIIETAIADGNSAVNDEAFECMIRQLLNCDSQPAVIPLVVTNSSLTDNGTNQAKMAFQYDLPMINFAAVAKSSTSDGTWKWTDLSVENGEDLNDSAHAFVANLLTTYFKRVLEGVNSSKYKVYSIPASTSTKCRYMNAKFLYHTKIDGTGFTNNDVPDAGFTMNRAWFTADGTEGVFNIEGTNIGIVWCSTINGKGGSFDVSVDGTKVREKLSGSNIGPDSTEEDIAKAKVTVSTAELGKLSPGSHEVKVTLSEGSEGKEFFILGFCVSD